MTAAPKSAEVRPSKTHNIKCWPDVFEEMRAGRKTAEFRYDDRGYRAGDALLIREWDTASGEYTHREITRRITHVLDGGFGMPAGYVMLSLATSMFGADYDCKMMSNAAKLVANLPAVITALSASPTPPESVTVREDDLTERQVRIAAWNAAKKSGASDDIGYAVVDAVVAEFAAIRLFSGGGE